MSEATLADSVTNHYFDAFPTEAVATVSHLADAELLETAETLSTASLLTLLDGLSPARASALFARLGQTTRLEALTLVPPRVAIGLLVPLADAERAELLDAVPAGDRIELERLIAVPPDAVAWLMDRAVDTVQAHMTVAEALERVRTASLPRVQSVCLVDADGRLDGYVDMQDLALAEPGERLAAHAHPVEAMVGVTSPRETVVELVGRHRVDAVPIIDRNRRLMGVVRYERLFEAVEEAASVDIQKMVGGSDELALSSPWFAIRQRLPWLHINLLTAFLAAAVVGVFEDVIARITALAVLLPVVAGQSGNAGAQALAVTMRGLVLREIGTREWRLVLGKELVVGMANGVALAVTCGLGVYLWSSSIGLALVIALAMVLAMVSAGIAGALVPIALTRFSQDPATASSIILTTVTDVAGFLSFLGIAAMLSFLL